jgi:hypothetical protein
MTHLENAQHTASHFLMRRAISVTLILAFALSSAASAAPALGPGSSWSEIRGTPNVLARPPLIFFGATGVPVTEVCVNRDSLRAVNHASVTTEVPVSSHSLSYDIEVEEIFGNGDRPHTRLLFLKHLDIPACV